MVYSWYEKRRILHYYQRGLQLLQSALMKKEPPRPHELAWLSLLKSSHLQGQLREPLVLEGLQK